MIQPVTIRSLLDAAVHFGHQTRRWNPKMKPYIFGDRNGVYILDLKQTLTGLDEAYTFVQAAAAAGGTILFVGTKKQAQEPVAENAQRCSMPYVNHRWLGGMLTNFVTIRSRVTYMEELEAQEADGRMAAMPKKEQIHLRKELEKLRANLDGIREMKSVPQAIFVVDTQREAIAISEAKRLGIPVVGIIDTNSDPDDVDYGIPGNDDAIRSVNLITEVIAEAVLSGMTRGSVSEEEISGSVEAPVADSDIEAGLAAMVDETVAVEIPTAEVAVAEAPVVEAPAFEAPVVETASEISVPEPAAEPALAFEPTVEPEPVPEPAPEAPEPVPEPEPTPDPAPAADPAAGTE